MNKTKKKIYVGLSGGVDSAVSLALLKKEGHEVAGVYIKSWFPDWIECDWKEDRRDAMRVCAHLGVPFIELNLEEVYKQEVIDMMIAEYKAGRTPNPDIACNREVKFGAFWQWAKAHGADAIATGHYAQIAPRRGAKLSIAVSPATEPHKKTLHPSASLVRGKDPAKDQSYFLWTLTQDDLAHILFPVGHMQKSDVRDLARKYKLPVADKRDSQGICFLGKVDLKEFLLHYVSSKPGNVLNEDGDTIGRHPGALFFTIGERHGFEILKKTPDDKPYYIVAKDVQMNTITVSQNFKNRSNAPAKIQIASVNQIVPWQTGKTYDVQIRYHGQLYGVNVVDVHQDNRTATLFFSKIAPLVAPGQSIVLYSRAVCLGGGIAV